MPNTMTLISTVTVGAGGVASFEFTSIPQTFTDLVLVISARSTYSALEAAMSVLPNADGAAVSTWRRLLGNGSSTNSDNAGSVTFPPTSIIPAATNTSNVFSNAALIIPNYAGSTNKTISVDSVNEANSTNGVTLQIYSQIWAKTTAVSSLYCSVTTGFAQYSTASLYGITKGSGGATVS